MKNDRFVRMTDKEILLSIFEKYEGAVQWDWLYKDAYRLIWNTIPDTITGDIERSDQAHERYEKAMESLLDEGIVEKCQVVARFLLSGKAICHKLPTGVEDPHSESGYSLVAQKD